MLLSTFNFGSKRPRRPLRPMTTAGRPPQKRKRLRRIPGLWARLALLSLMVIALIVGMVGLTLKAIRPYRQGSVEAASLAATRFHIRKLNGANAALERRIAYLKTPAGIAAEAHPLGFVYPGEHILVMSGYPVQNADEYSMQGAIAPLAPAAAQPSLMARFWSQLREK
jgi:hypothetical protein